MNENTMNKEDQLIIQSLAKLDSLALGVAVGTLCGIGVFLATAALLVKGGESIGPNLALLGQYFIGYEVTPLGSIIGLIYGLLFGFIVGWLFAIIRNLIVSIYVSIFKIKSNFSSVNDFLDNP